MAEFVQTLKAHRWQGISLVLALVILANISGVTGWLIQATTSVTVELPSVLQAVEDNEDDEEDEGCLSCQRKKMGKGGGYVCVNDCEDPEEYCVENGDDGECVVCDPSDRSSTCQSCVDEAWKYQPPAEMDCPECVGDAWEPNYDADDCEKCDPGELPEGVSDDCYICDDEQQWQDNFEAPECEDCRPSEQPEDVPRECLTCDDNQEWEDIYDAPACDECDPELRPSACATCNRDAGGKWEGCPEDQPVCNEDEECEACPEDRPHFHEETGECVECLESDHCDQVEGACGIYECVNNSCEGPRADPDECDPGDHCDSSTWACVECEPGLKPSMCHECDNGDWVEKPGKTTDCDDCENGTWVTDPPTNCHECKDETWEEKPGRWTECHECVGNDWEGCHPPNRCDEETGECDDPSCSDDSECGAWDKKQCGEGYCDKPWWTFGLGSGECKTQAIDDSCSSPPAPRDGSSGAFCADDYLGPGVSQFQCCAWTCEVTVVRVRLKNELSLTGVDQPNTIECTWEDDFDKCDPGGECGSSNAYDITLPAHGDPTVREMALMCETRAGPPDDCCNLDR